LKNEDYKEIIEKQGKLVELEGDLTGTETE